MTGLLEPRDRGLKHRASKFRQSIAFYFAGFGLPVVNRDDVPVEPIKISEALGDADWTPPHDGDAGSLLGLANWSLTTKSDQRHDWSGNLREAERRKGRKRWAAVIGYRRSPARASDQYAMVSLQTLAEVIRVTEGLPD